jgi:imidazolonepropionase-like amidohydrolase
MALGVLALVPVLTALAAEPPASEVLFRNVRVFDGTSAALSGPTAVLVRGNTIAAIGTGAVAASPAATVIDGAGRTLMPGLIDNHVHIFMSASSQAELMDPKATFGALEAKAAAEPPRATWAAPSSASSDRSTRARVSGRGSTRAAP